MMNEPAHDPSFPTVPDDDPETDRMLSGLGRFSPQQGFEDRVVGRVQVPFPRWARSLRAYVHGLTSGVTGWTLLATFSLATAAAWGSVAVLGVRYSSELGLLWNPTSRQITRVFRDAARQTLPALETARAWVAEWLGGVGLDIRTAAIGYGAVALVCVVALWRLTAEPHKTRGPVDAAS